MKRKTLPKARHFSEVENRLCVGGGAAKEFPAPHFSRPCARGVGGVYKVASAGLSGQLCSAAGRGTRWAQPGQGPEACRPLQPWRPETRRTHGGRPPRAFARRPQWPRKGAGEGGGCSRPVVRLELRSS